MPQINKDTYSTFHISKLITEGREKQKTIAPLRA